jgi:PleD family two-component response regulator
MTFGVAVYSGSASVEAAVRRADEALYGGKHRGKNQVVLENVDSQALTRSA